MSENEFGFAPMSPRPGSKPADPVDKTSFIGIYANCLLLLAVSDQRCRTTEGPMTKVERREVPRPTSLGARGWRYQLRKAEPTLPGGCPVEHPGASRRSIGLACCEVSLALARRGVLAKLGRIGVARMRKLGCLIF
jgi:hypothetical protein